MTAMHNIIYLRDGYGQPIWSKYMSKQEELETKVSEEEPYEYEVFTGVVEWFHIERGYGFISWEKEGVKQKDMFCHFSDIDIDGFKLLKGGQTVSFSIGTNNAGSPKAINVKVIR